MLQAVALSLGASALRALVVLAHALLFVFLARRSSASLRRLALVLAFAIALALPVAFALVPTGMFTRVVPTPASRVFAEALSNVPALAAVSSQTDVVAEVAAPAAFRALPWALIVLALWSVGTAACVARFGFGLWRARALVKRASPTFRRVASGDGGPRAANGIRVTDEIHGPLVAGVLRPTILLPAEAAAWSGEFLRAVLAHEGAHVRRRDGLAMALAHLACTLYWFNPLAWFALDRLRRECELAADEDVVAAGVRPSTYAKHLLTIARTRPFPAGAMAMSESQSELAVRVETLVSRAALPSRLRSHTALVSLGAAALFAGAACSNTGPAASASLGKVPTVATHELRSSVQPTHDSHMQSILDAEAVRIKVDFDPKRVALVAIDPSTGSVVAISDDHPGQEVEPASTLKPLVVALALDARVIDRAERFDCGQGTRSYGAEVLHDYKANGMLDATQILAVSSNVGMTRIYDKLGGAALSEGLRKLRIQVPQAEEKSLAGAVRALGLGVTTLPEDLARAYTIFANDGMYVSTNADGATSRERIVGEDAARAVRIMLEEAVHGKLATGRAAQIANARVGGKTGTTGGDEADRFATFVGLVPADHPRYVIYVGVSTTRDESGGSLAAPIFARIASRALTPR